MKASFRAGITGILACALLGVGIGIAVGEEETPKPAPYLDKATYVGMDKGKCRMCHSPEAKAWDKTRHALIAQEADKFDAEKVPADMLYRYTTGFNADKTHVDKGNTCEGCHGPGSEHKLATPKAERPNTITNPEKMKTEGQKLSLCGRCHGQYTYNGQRMVLNFKPGQDLLKTEGFKLDAVKPNGKFQEMNEIVGSEHFKNGVACITCHDSHSKVEQTDKAAKEFSLKKPIVELCTGCHAKITMKEHAPAAAADATCATCHMPNGAHTFAKPAK